jgi:hypothetical protein
LERRTTCLNTATLESATLRGGSGLVGADHRSDPTDAWQLMSRSDLEAAPTEPKDDAADRWRTQRVVVIELPVGGDSHAYYDALARLFETGESRSWTPSADRAKPGR